MAQSQDKRPGTLRTLGIAYLVWACVSALAVIVILLFATLAYCGVYPVKGELSQTVTVLGVSVSVWVLLALSWLFVVTGSLAALGFGASCLVCEKRPSTLRPAIILGRVAFVLALIDLLFCVVQADGVSFVCSLISLVLTGALALEVRKVPDAGEALPHRSFVVESAQNSQAREERLEGETRGLHASCSGYATIMLAWGGLRILYGLALLFSMPLGLAQDHSAFAIASSLVIVAVGAYLIATGRSGKRALDSDGRLAAFVRFCQLGVIVSGAACALFAVLMLNDIMPTSGEVFCAVVDLALCLGGFVNARKLSTVIA